MKLIEFLALVAVAAMFWFATLAQCQYGNPNDPYLDYQRQQREKEQLELQRRQVQAIERAEWERQLYRTLVEPTETRGEYQDATY